MSVKPIKGNHYPEQGPPHQANRHSQHDSGSAGATDDQLAISSSSYLCLVKSGATGIPSPDPTSPYSPYVLARLPVSHHDDPEGIGTASQHEEQPVYTYERPSAPDPLRNVPIDQGETLPIATTPPTHGGTRQTGKRQRRNRDSRAPSLTNVSSIRGTGRSEPLPSMAWANDIFSGSEAASPTDVLALLQEAAEAARNDFDEDSALQWAQGYSFPAQYLESDRACLRAAQLDFVAMVRRRLKILAPHRLNLQRVGNLRPDNPEIPLLAELAIGMHVPLPEGFTPNGKETPTPLRSTYVTVAPAVNKMLGDIVEQRLAFLLPYEDAVRYVPNLHLCKAHWTRKKGKPSGRPLGDLTYVDGTPLNTPAMSDAATAHYGAILHPTIEDIATMICAFWVKTTALDPTACWTLLRIWKMDLKGAYTLLSFRPEDVGLFAMMLTDSTVYLQIAGIFGWAGTPAAFQVVTRAIKWELQHRLRSSTIMYVDDIIGVCMAQDLVSDLALARETCVSLLGPTAVADDKTETGRRLDVIGYVVDLDTQRVLISRKNFLTTLNGFATVNLDGAMTLRTAQKLASWASRYGKICRVMRPFCGALNRLIAGRSESHATFPVSPEARIAIKCWTAMLCLVRYQETRFTRTLESFAPAVPLIIVEFDASLSGAGLIWYQVVEGREVVRGVSAIDLTGLGFQSDSSFQNLAEFIGAILAVLGHVALGSAGQSIALRGDSVTALTWALTERPRGSIATNASMVWTLLCVAADVHVTDITHIPGTENDSCDQLSRRGSSPTTTLTQHAALLGLGVVSDVGLDRDPDATALVTMCNPTIPTDTDLQFATFWKNAQAAVDRFVAKHRSPGQPLP